MGSKHKWIAFPVLPLFLLCLVFFTVYLLGRQSLWKWMNWTQNTLSSSFSRSNASYYSILCDGELFNNNKRILSHSSNIRYVFWIFLAQQVCKKETCVSSIAPSYCCFKNMGKILCLWFWKNWNQSPFRNHNPQISSLKIWRKCGF